MINPRRNTSKHILTKLTKGKDKHKILKAIKEKWEITYRGTPIRLSADSSTETLQARREWHDIFKVMKRKNLQPRILYPARLSFRFDGAIKSFATKQKLREVSTTKPVQFNRSVMSYFLRPHGLQHARHPCLSPTPGACSNSCLSSCWCHPTILSSVVPFSSGLQSFS